MFNYVCMYVCLTFYEYELVNNRRTHEDSFNFYTLSCDLFNFIIENPLSTTMSSYLRTLTDIDIIGRTKRDVNAAFSSNERASIQMGLSVNESKTKHMSSTISGNIRLWSVNLVILFLSLPQK